MAANFAKWTTERLNGDKMSGTKCDITLVGLLRLANSDDASYVPDLTVLERYAVNALREGDERFLTEETKRFMVEIKDARNS